MTQINDEFDSAIAEVESLKKRLKGKLSIQVRSADEQSLAKATALAWFRNHRPILATHFSDDSLSEIDLQYRQILDYSHKAGMRSAYVATLTTLRKTLVDLRGEHIVRLSSSGTTHSSDSPPKFAPLIANPAMQKILERRWTECNTCIEHDAPLAAIVMMGGLLEALLLSRVHRETNMAPIFKTKAAPVGKGGKVRPLNEWALKNFLDVSHEMGWITRSAKDVGDVLRDYRNYIHPNKELSHGVAIEKDDALLMWEISKTLSRQIIKSVP